MSRVAMRKRGIRIAAVLLLIMGSAFAKVRKLETVQTDGSVSVVRPRVALTFDDGPSPKYTPVLLDGLKERNVHATFFLLGKNIKKNQKLVQRMQREGHLLGNHTYNHVQLDKISETTAKQEILRTNNEIYETAGIYPEYMRPPYGAWKKNLELCVEMLPVFWTIDTLDWKTKDAYANMDIAGYNYGLFRYKHDLKKYPKRLILGTETFCKDAYSFWEIAKKNKRILGDFVWSGWEYIGETGDGAAEYEDYKGKMPHTRMTGNNGRIDLLGKPRAEAAYTRVAFERETGPFIAVKPVYQKENLNLTGWALTKALESWSWRGCAGEKAEVEVFARAAEVELLVNGKKAARGKVKKCRTKFHIPYEDGEITAVSYDKNGREINRQTLVTANKETMLHIKPEQETVEAGRLLFVPLQYGDFNGIWKPMEKHHLKVTVENATLEGLGSACSYVEGNYAQDTVDTYYGEAMAVVRAGESGSVKLTVSDEEKTYTCEIPVTTQK